MPELPEVETVRRTAESKICHKKIIGVQVNREDILDGITKNDFIMLLRNNTVERMERRGKYLIFRFASGDGLILHLRMTGQLISFDNSFDGDRHCHIVVHFEQGGFYYRDVRRFGRFCLIGSDGKTERGMNQLGYEPLDPAFTAQYLKDGMVGRRCAVKTKILDQHFIAGIGNIYADEILFAAKIHPESRCADLTDSQIHRLQKAAVKILLQAIADRGTTFSDFRDGYGEIGGHQEYLAVFHRAGEPCHHCGAIIEKIKCGGRTTSFCPQCQKR